MNKILIALAILVAAGCATVTSPENECRITTMDGEGRYGTFTQYVSGGARMVRIVEAGNGCPYYSVQTPDVQLIHHGK